MPNNVLKKFLNKSHIADMRSGDADIYDFARSIDRIIKYSPDSQFLISDPATSLDAILFILNKAYSKYDILKKCRPSEILTDRIAAVESCIYGVLNKHLELFMPLFFDSRGKNHTLFLHKKCNEMTTFDFFCLLGLPNTTSPEARASHLAIMDKVIEAAPSMAPDSQLPPTKPYEFSRVLLQTYVGADQKDIASRIMRLVRQQCDTLVWDIAARSRPSPICWQILAEQELLTEECSLNSFNLVRKTLQNKRYLSKHFNALVSSPDLYFSNLLKHMENCGEQPPPLYLLSVSDFRDKQMFDFIYSNLAKKLPARLFASYIEEKIYGDGCPIIQHECTGRDIFNYEDPSFIRESIKILASKYKFRNDPAKCVDALLSEDAVFLSPSNLIYFLETNPSFGPTINNLYDRIEVVEATLSSYDSKDKLDTKPSVRRSKI